MMLLSECGKYTTDSDQRAGYHVLKNAETGIDVVTSTFWSYERDNKRIRFRTGSGKIQAAFSYPRYPSWFKRRWIECFGISCEDVARIAVTCGAEVLVCYKPDMNCYHHLGVRASAKTMKAFDAAMIERGVPCFSRKQSWDIECPQSARFRETEAAT